MKFYAWNVMLWWTDPRGSFSSGANTIFPVTMGPMEVIAEVAKWRGVDLSACHDVSATRGKEMIDAEAPAC